MVQGKRFECFVQDEGDFSSAWGLSFRRLVIIKQSNVERISALETKNDAPVGPNCHRPETNQITFERMEAIARKIKCLGSVCLVETGKNILHRVQYIRPYAAPVASLVKPFQAAVFETPNHEGTP
jgi:hypothetical protein